MTPLMWSAAPSAVKSRSRYARRFSSVDSAPIESKRFLIVPVLSSAARMPLPGATRARAVLSRSLIPARVYAQVRAHLGPRVVALEDFRLLRDRPFAGHGRLIDCCCAGSRVQPSLSKRWIIGGL